MKPEIIGNIESGILSILGDVILPICLHWLLARHLQRKTGKIVSRLLLPVPAQHHTIVRFDIALPAPVPPGRPGNTGAVIADIPDALLARTSVCSP